MKKVIKLPISGRYKADLEIELREKARSYDGQRTTSLYPVPEKFFELSVCGTIYEQAKNNRWMDYSGGQNIEEIASIYKHNRKVQRIAELWREWHLNDMNAGTIAQDAVINEYQEANPEWRYDYGEACNILKAAGLYEDHEYKYGSAWLAKVMPDNVVKEIMSL